MKSLNKVALAAVSLVSAGGAMAQAITDPGSLAASVDFTPANAPIAVVAGALVVFYVAFRSVKWVLGMAKRG